MRLDLEKDVLATTSAGDPVRLSDLWPDPDEVAQLLNRYVSQSDFTEVYRSVDQGSKAWQALSAPGGSTFEWDKRSLYICRPSPAGTKSDRQKIVNARILLKLGDSTTTDHISPVGAIAPDSPAGRYLLARGVAHEELNTFGARRGNHEVMLRGTFDNPQLANQFLPDRLGGWALGADGETVRSVYHAAMDFAEAGIATVICAGHAYGSGSARDWAAKGSAGLGVRAVIARSFERIHRTNLILCGVLPLILPLELDWDALNLSAHDEISLMPVDILKPDGPVLLTLSRACGTHEEIVTSCAIRTNQELAMYLGGGVLPAYRAQLMQKSLTKYDYGATIYPSRSPSDVEGLI